MADFAFFDDSGDEAPPVEIPPVEVPPVADCWATLLATPSEAAASDALSAEPPTAPPDPALFTAPARAQLWSLLVADPDRWLPRLIALPHGSALCQTLIGTPDGLLACFRRLSLTS
jgi:hypothetical protein